LVLSLAETRSMAAASIWLLASPMLGRFGGRIDVPTDTRRADGVLEAAAI
jgi:hypothetical protein